MRVGTCNRPTSIHGGCPCPRLKGHPGECYWWLTWEGGYGEWRVIVYSGTAYDRRKRCCGVFTEPPTAEDVNRLLRTLSPLRKAELARRTPESEPDPLYRTVPPERIPVAA